jgi:parallel beta-helix repeat protein
MKKLTSRLLAILMTLGLVCGTLPGQVLAAEIDDEDAPETFLSEDSFQDEEPAAEAEESDPEEPSDSEEEPSQEADDLDAAVGQGADALDEISQVSGDVQLMDTDGSGSDGSGTDGSGSNENEGESDQPSGPATDPDSGEILIDIDPDMMVTANPRDIIQRALYLANQYEEMVRVTVPSGAYMMSGSLTIFSNTHLVLQPDTVLVRGPDAQSNSMLRTRDDADALGYNSAQNIIVEGGVWDGNSTSETGLTSLMVFRHCRNLTFRSMTITHATHHSLNVSSSDGVLVQNVLFTDTVELPDSTVGSYIRSNFECIHTDYEGLSDNAGYDGSVPQNITVTGCTFRNVYAGVGTHNRGECNGVKTYAQNINISKNTFENVNGRCINAYQFQGLTVKKNSAVNVADFLLMDDSSGTISGNSAAIRPRSGVEPFAVKVMSGSAAGKLTISKNAFSGSVYRMLNLKNCAGLTVSGNKLSGSAHRMLHVESCPSAKISGNAISGSKAATVKITWTEPPSSDSKTTTVSVTGCPKAALSGNTITGTGRDRVLYVTESSGAKLTKNKVTVSKSVNAVYIRKSSKVQVLSNTVKGGTEDAIHMSETAKSTVSGNTVTKPGQAGIKVTTSCSKCKVLSNKVTGTSAKVTTQGIYVSNGANSCSVRQNSVRKAGTGIYITGNSGASLAYNTVRSSGTASIYLTGTVKKAKLHFNDLRKDKGFRAASAATWTMTGMKQPAVATGTSNRTVSVKWKKLSSASGYQVQYAKVKSFKSAKAVTIASKKAVRKTILTTKRRMKLFVRVRAYRKVGKATYYTDWSPVGEGRTK